MRAGRLFALASVEIDIDGVRIEVRGIRAMRVPTGATRVELPTFRDAAGQSRAAIILPDEVHGPIGDAAIEALIERGLAKRADPGLITAGRRLFAHIFCTEKEPGFQRLGFRANCLIFAPCSARPIAEATVGRADLHRG